ncbi:hypothetical protein BY996DRAFT_6705354 [Phakopsora pachyrhizi]|nr:hypothetical protein BY996DRAFT_6705354 [Phakopsora pachyrhizi]
MLGPLSRLPNWCKSDEVETLLTEAKKLGSDYLSLIFEVSMWIFLTSSDSLPMTIVALEIFTADLSMIESLPWSEVVEFLERQSLITCLLYLEHLIHGLNDRTPTFHEKWIHVYIIEFKRLRLKGDLDDARETYEKLLDHLYSPYYSPNWVLARALTLGRMGHHDAALSIYVYQLSNIFKAEE